ncbi:MAG: hypothetical protein LBE99_01555 [Puniceicoccales bacterium]|jgi:hypothetical protein|nr:hypothetical protein [Puniceicoccales bacterium]
MEANGAEVYISHATIEKDQLILMAVVHDGSVKNRFEVRHAVNGKDKVKIYGVLLQIKSLNRRVRSSLFIVYKLSNL